MSQYWTFTDLEFYGLWYSQLGAHLPAPFLFRTELTSASEFDAIRHEAVDGLRARWDPRWTALLETIEVPDIKLVAEGWDENEIDRPEGIVRVLAVRRGDTGFVIAEAAGASFWHGGAFTVVECAAVELASAVVERMPEVPAGARREIVLSADRAGDELDYSYGRSSVRDSFSASPADRTADFFAAPTERVGSIAVVQGRSLYGPRGMTGHRLHWRDLVGDGRYVVDDSPAPVARATSRRQLTDVLNARIAEVVRAIKDERA